ncbi:MAG: 6-phosphogluconolactonase [Pseudomonadota bacterium]
MSLDVQVFTETPSLVAALADRIEGWVDEAITTRGKAHVVLAGGSTPQALHEQLAARALPWSSIDFYFGDERCVPADHEHANFRAAKKSLLSRVPVREAQIHRMRGEAGANAARDYENELPERFDVMLLGMGEDGHTASLFPNASSLESPERVIYVDDSPKPPPERITLGLRAINASRHVAFMVTGAGKAPALAQVLTQRVKDPLPAARVQPDDGTLTFFIDTSAAAALEGQPHD